MELYLQDNGQAAGPYPLKQIKELIIAGTITPDLPAAANAGGPWKPLREWPELTATPEQTPLPAASTEEGSGAEPLMTALHDAHGALKQIADNPAGGIVVAFNMLGGKRALGAGLALGAAFALCVAIALPRLQMDVFALGFISDDILSGAKSDWFKIFVDALVPFGSLAVCLLAARKFLRGSNHPIGADFFVAGAALLPIGVALLLNSFIGVENWRINVMLLVVAQCLTVQMLHTGCIRVAGLSERVASWATPIILLLSVWLATVVRS